MQEQVYRGSCIKCKGERLCARFDKKREKDGHLQLYERAIGCAHRVSLEQQVAPRFTARTERAEHLDLSPGPLAHGAQTGLGLCPATEFDGIRLCRPADLQVRTEAADSVKSLIC